MDCGLYRNYCPKITLQLRQRGLWQKKGRREKEGQILNALSQEEAKEHETPDNAADNEIITDRKGIQIVLPLPATPYVSKPPTAEAENKIPRGISTP